MGIWYRQGTISCFASETANTHPKTKTLGGYTFLALPAEATSTTHTLLTNPTTHYMVGDYSVLPNNPNTWIPYSSTITKTIYDPCPYGYRVPINGSWTDFPKKTWTQYTVNEGQSWPATNGGWWPAAGNREGSSAILYTVGANGYYWSSSRHATVTNAYGLAFAYTGWVSPSNRYNRSHGFPVRCIEEKKINKTRWRN